MTKPRTLIAASCAALALAAAPAARAQDPAPVSDNEAGLDAVEPIISELVEKLRPLAASAGIELPDLMQNLGPLMRAAFPSPADDLEGWAFGLNFENSDSATDNGSATDGRQEILADAQACAARYPNAGQVVHFRRIRRQGMTGHQCALLTYDGPMGVLISESYAEGADRHMSASYDAAASTHAVETTRALLEPAVEANIALAITLSELALDAAIRKVVD